MSAIPLRRKLGLDDVKDLLKGKTEEERAREVVALCRRIDASKLSEKERLYANEIIDMLAVDAAERIRHAVAYALQHSTNLPRETASKLAKDIDQIALPILRNSPMLNDPELIEIVLNGSDKKQIAIASRQNISLKLTETLTQNACEDAVKTVCANENATHSDETIIQAVERFPKNENLKTALADRQNLPPLALERLISEASGEIFDRLVNTHELPPRLAITIANEARSSATIDLVEQTALSHDIPALIREMRQSGRLTASLIIRAACIGAIDFVEYALAELARVPHHRAWLMVHDKGELGLKALFLHAGLPQRYYTILRIALSVHHDLLNENNVKQANDTPKTRRLELILTQLQGAPAEEVNYLLSKFEESLRQAA